MLETHSETDRSMHGTQTPPVNAPAARRRRPFGVNAVIVLLVLSFIGSTLAAVVLPFGWYEIPPDQRLSIALDVGTSLVVGLASLVVAWGLFRLKRWAWFGVMILTGLGLLISIWQYFRGAQPYMDLLLNSLIAFYLNQRDVQSRFGTAPPSEEPAQ